jgi:hypothetical protein
MMDTFYQVACVGYRFGRRTILFGVRFSAAVVILSLMVSTSASAAENKKEKSMWRGTIMMEFIKRHQYNISETNKSGGRREDRRKHYKVQRATVQILAADIFSGGNYKVNGTIHAQIDNYHERTFTQKRGGKSITRDIFKGNASNHIKDNEVFISLSRKSHIDAAKAIEKEVGRCGADPDCLAKVYDKFKGVVEDGATSFPIKMVVQLRTDCQGPTNSLNERIVVEPGKPTKHEKDGPHTRVLGICVPMACEMDGIYTRGKDGDRITAWYSKSDELPYRAWNDQDYPIKGVARCTVNLTNGPPEIRIYRLSDDEPPRDITDKEEKVLVGESIKLQASVVGTGIGQETERKWEIPDEIIRNWQATQGKAYRVEVKDKAFSKGIIRFAWIDGDSRGRKKTVTLKATFSKIEMEGKTEFIVYEPDVEVLEFEKGSSMGISGQSSACELAPAKILSGHEGESLGIKLKTRVSLPKAFADRRHCIQFVQMIKSSNVWCLRRIGEPQYEWMSLYLVGLLDTTYPYAGPVCGGRTTTLEMRDNPNAPLSSMASMYIHDQFDTYLMFRPGPDLDKNSIWVPLKRIDWGWKAKVLATGDPYGRTKKSCDTRYHSIVSCEKPPVAFNPQVNDTILYPEWSQYYNEKKHKPKATWQITSDPNETPPRESGWLCP